MVRAPSPWVVRFAPLVAEGRAVLDVACGSGRHLRLFADRGHAVTGIDRDLSEVTDLDQRSGVKLRKLDLETEIPPTLGTASFAGVVVTNYLHRPLFSRLLEALEPDGVLIYETFAVGNERHRRPRNPAFLLQPGELLRAVEGAAHVVAYEHGTVGGDEPAVVQRICATRSGSIEPADRRLD